MDKGLYSRILNALYEQGVASEMDVWPLFDGYYLQPQVIGEAVHYYRYQRFNPILQQMKNNGHVNFEPNLSSRIENDVKGTAWDSQFPVIVSITSEGYEYYDRYLINQSVFGLNGTLKGANETLAKNSTDQTNIFNRQLKIYRGQLWILALTALFSIVSLGLGWLTYQATVNMNLANDKIDDLRKIITNQNKQINHLRTELLKKQSQVVSGIRR